MYEQVEKSKENKSRAVANAVAQKKSDGKQSFGFVDYRNSYQNDAGKQVKPMIPFCNDRKSTINELGVNATQKNEGVMQRVVIFQVDDDYQVINTQYIRELGREYLINGGENKHATADITFRNAFIKNMEGLELGDAVQNLVDLGNQYQELPSLDLEDLVRQGDWDWLEEKRNTLEQSIGQAEETLFAYDNEDDDVQKRALAFTLQNNLITLTRNIENFRVAVPTVNMWDGIQHGGGEAGPANILEAANLNGGPHLVENDITLVEACWGLYDFGTLTTLNVGNNATVDELTDAYEWLDLNQLNDMNQNELNEVKMRLVTASLRNHITQLELSYPEVIEHLGGQSVLDELNERLAALNLDDNTVDEIMTVF